MINDQPLIFDGHNDVLGRMFVGGEADKISTFIDGRDGALDLQKTVTGGFGGGFFAIFAPSKSGSIARHTEMSKTPYDVHLPDALDISDASRIVHCQISILIRLHKENALELCTTSKQIQDCMKRGKLAAIMHIEGAEAIDKDLYALDIFYRAGLRSLGPVWSRPTIFGHGVPFRFPSDGDIGPGLSEAGIRLVHRCNQLRIMLDVSHLNEAGFWDIAKLSDAPLVATHSNAHHLCPASRNLTDRQLKAIAESDGMVGVNFSTAFLRADGQKKINTPLTHILKHLDYLIDILGEDRVGFGSDYDGAQVPAEISNAAKLPNLRAEMRSHGYDEPLMNKLCHQNWLRVLRKTWGA